jgi:hypothetical protein
MKIEVNYDQRGTFCDRGERNMVVAERCGDGMVVSAHLVPSRKKGARWNDYKRSSTVGCGVGAEFAEVA